MTPCNRIRKEIIERVYQAEGIYQPVSMDTDNSVEDYWKHVTNGELDDAVAEVTDELRHGAINTDIPCESSRNYESKSVAMEFNDGAWVGWTYWFGGGKHAEPKSVAWMEQAYYLNVKETYYVSMGDPAKTITQHTWTKVGENEILVVEKPKAKQKGRHLYCFQFESILDRVLEDVNKQLGNLEQTTHGVICRPGLDSVIQNLAEACADPTPYTVSTASQIIKQYLQNKYPAEWFKK